MIPFELKYIKGQISPAEYWDRVRSKWYFVESCHNCDGLEEFIKDTLTKAFWALNDLDRKNEFWENSNKLATYNKLSAFADFLIKQDIDPVMGAFVKIFTAIIHGLNHLIPEYWGILKSKDQINYSWLVNTAWNQSSVCVDMNISRLGELIKILNIQNEIAPFLKQLQESQCKIEISSYEWVNEVKSAAGMAF